MIHYRRWSTKSEDAIGKTAAPQVEAEPPAVELIARKDLDAPKISMEPLPADEPVQDIKLPDDVVSEEKKQEAPASVSEKETQSSNVDAPKVDAPKTDSKTEVPAPAVTPAPVSTKAPAQKAPVQKTPTPVIPADPNTFIVTVGQKAAPHPSIGKGHAMGFLINGVSGKRLILERGKSYTFDIRTDAKHDVYLSKKR